MMDLYPIEKLVEIQNEPDFIGRIIVHKIKENYHVEVDVVTTESQKIFKHLGIYYGFMDPVDALDSGYRELVKAIGAKT
jgi:hypothetical protein